MAYATIGNRNINIPFPRHARLNNKRITTYRTWYTISYITVHGSLKLELLLQTKLLANSCLALNRIQQNRKEISLNWCYKLSYTATIFRYQLPNFALLLWPTTQVSLHHKQVNLLKGQICALICIIRVRITSYRISTSSYLQNRS